MEDDNNTYLSVDEAKILLSPLLGKISILTNSNAVAINNKNWDVHIRLSLKIQEHQRVERKLNNIINKG